MSFEAHKAAVGKTRARASHEGFRMSGDGPGREDVIVIQNDDDISSRPGNAQVDRSRLALITLAQIGNVGLKSCYYAPAIVLRSVIDDQDFTVRICLPDRRLNCLPEQFSAVVSGYDNGEQHLNSILLFDRYVAPIGRQSRRIGISSRIAKARTDPDGGRGKGAGPAERSALLIVLIVLIVRPRPVNEPAVYASWR